MSLRPPSVGLTGAEDWVGVRKMERTLGNGSRLTSTEQFTCALFLHKEVKLAGLRNSNSLIYHPEGRGSLIKEQMTGPW